MKTSVIACVLTLCILFCDAQTPHFLKHNLPSEFKSAEITSILQSRTGFIWLGTSQGLLRYDGFSFKAFTEIADSVESISCLYEDSKGILWTGQRNGRISRLMNEQFLSRENIPDATVPITGFSEDQQGQVWVSTYGSGLIVLTGDKSVAITYDDGLGDNYIYAIASDKRGNVLAGTDAGISICSLLNGKKRVQVVSSQNGLPDNIVTSLAISPDDKIFAGTESSGVAVLDDVYRVRSILSHEKNFGRVTSILPVESGLWLGTADHGAIEIDSSGNFINVLRNDDVSLPDRVNDLMKDNEGNIWIASTSDTFYSGNRIFSFFHTRKNDISKNIQSLVYSRDDKLWFSTNQGVFVVNTVGTRRRAESIRFPSTVSPQVISLFEDHTGKIWMGTFDHGVFIYNPDDKSMQQLTERDGLNNNNVLSIGGVGNQIWFATLGGVSNCNIHQMPNGRMSFLFEDHKSGEDLGRNYVYKIHVDKKKRIWFATDGKGVFVFDHGKFRNHLIRGRSKSNIVYSLTEDASGGIWASTANAGLFRFNGNDFEPFIPQNQIRDLALTSIVGDKNGKVLLVSKQGIDVLDPQSKIIFYHGQESGIDNIDPNLNAFTYDGMGNIWLGTQNGIVKYNTNMPPVKKWPVTKINEVQVFLSKVDTTRRKFNHTENHISFDYVGLWYQDPADVSYKLKLQGYDREWISSKNHFITYPSLPPGRYIFMVLSSATNNFNGAPVQKYSFEIAPPFYNTAVFYVLCGLMFFGVMYWFVNEREKKLRETQKQEREKIQFQLETLKNQVNPHFLFNSFNTLIGVIEQDHETAVQYVEKLSDFYRDILINREKDVIPLAKEIDMIKNYYFLQVKRYKNNLRIHLEVPEEFYEHSIPPLTLQLLVENAIKHNIISSDKKLIIDIFVREEDLFVRNNLQRKIMYEPSTGLGLQNIINRYKLLSDKEVKIEETASHFLVRAPLFKPVKYEGHHYRG